MNTQQSNDSIRILTNENYIHWKRLTESLLKAKSLLKYIQFNENQEDNEAGAAYYVISCSLDDKMFAQFQSLTTPYSLWKGIEDSLASYGSNEGILIENQLKDCYMIDNDPITFINKLEELFMKCQRFNRILSEQQKLDYLLKGLRGQYAMICLIFIKTPENERTFNEAKKAIDFIRPYLIQNEKNAKIEKKCNKCGKNGHSTNQCWTNVEGINHIGSHEFAFIQPNLNIKSNRILDSGASKHYTNSKNLYIPGSYKECKYKVNASGTFLEAWGHGDINVTTKNTNGNIKTFTISNVSYVPHLPTNLISEAKLTQDNIEIFKKGDRCTLTFTDDNTKIEIIKDKRTNLYALKTIDEFNKRELKDNRTTMMNIMEAHRALRHVNLQQLRAGIQNGNLYGIKIVGKDQPCITCGMSKSTMKSASPETPNRKTEPLELIHCDIAGPFSTQTYCGKSYFIIFVDDYSRLCWTYLITKRSEALDKLIMFKTFAETQMKSKIMALRTDNALEFTSSAFETYLSTNGIKHELSAPYCHYQNGIAERMNRVLEEMTRCMLHESKLSKEYWGEAVLTATYLRNRLPTRANTGRTPYEMGFGRTPSLQHVKPFGYKCLVHNAKPGRNKLNDTALEGVLLGYRPGTKNYRILLTKSKKITESPNVKFIAMEFSKLKWSENLETEPTIHLSNQETESDEEKTNTEDTENNDRTLRNRSKVHYGEKRQYNKRTQTTNPDEPTWREAIHSTEKQEWIHAIESEINSLEENGTWETVPATNIDRMINSKFVLKRKKNVDGSIAKYKARLVANGLRQVAGVDYQETFSPVARFGSIYLCLVWAISKKLLVHHIDFSTAYLNAEIKETVIMRPPPGLTELFPKYENVGFKLKKSIYGLKQSGRNWNILLHETLKCLGWKQIASDNCIYLSGNNIICVYVDDLIIIAITEEDLAKIKKELKNTFSLQDEGTIEHYLGISIDYKPDKSRLDISQTTQIKELALKSEIHEFKTPMEANYYPTNNKNTINESIKSKFQSLLGSILYISRISMPDVAVAINILSTQTTNPTEEHMQMLERVVSYMRSTKGLKLQLQCRTFQEIRCFVDANWGGDPNTRKSITGYAIFIDKALISWKSKHQKVVAHSTMESEYVAADEGLREALWLQQLAKEITGLHLNIKMFIDNETAIAIIKDPKDHERRKHIDIRHHFIKDCYKEDKFKISSVESTENYADIFTKALGKTSSF